MLDINFIRDNKDLVAEAAKRKGIDFDLNKLIEVDDRRRAVLSSVEEKRKEQNEFSEKIAKETSSNLKVQYIEKMRSAKEALQFEEEKLREALKEWHFLMVQVPNIPDVSVPDGVSEADNKQIREWGKKPTFDFSIKDHTELMSGLNLADFERGIKAAGFRGYFLSNEGFQLSFALWSFVLDWFQKKGGFTSLLAPSLLRREPFMGTGYLPQGEEDLYKTQDGEFLSGTAEVATMSYFMDEVMPKDKLPMKFVAFSPCFRREAGSHGRDTKGLVRVHEFYKVEQVVLCEASHEESVKYHEELTKNAEEIVQTLKIPYRVVVNCGGDLGLGQVKKYDIECWVPSEDKYRETHSSSYFHDFQTRRLNIRYKDSDGKMRFVHSLNNTALATPRFLVPLVENYQQKDGSIKIPEVLVPYMGGKKEIKI
ncbi:MAG: serine--tRNA ligase [Candidatus Zambryskibacteria bacterium RIFCSPHIGHO2_12_FULL_44_12b]|nr:MAG: serine--tRNA ligase [Candidatus Zambryskibacteria bacterium RIFCSPHIGHO2_12_FULL_44_12b]